MSDERDPTRDQVLPTPNENPFIQELVIADIQERMQHGIRKYGTALQVGNGRKMLQDLYEELIDAAVYIKGAIETDKAYLSIKKERCDVEVHHGEHFYDYDGPWRFCDGDV